MKKYIILLAVVACGVLSSCGTLTEAPRSTFKTFLDFRPYISEGFYISSTPYTGDAVVLGELFIDVTPGFKEVRYGKEGQYDAIVSDFIAVYGYERIQAAELLQEAVETAKGLGSNGLSNFKIEKTYASGAPVYSVRATCLKIEK